MFKTILKYIFTICLVIVFSIVSAFSYTNTTSTGGTVNTSSSTDVSTSSESDTIPSTGGSDNPDYCTSLDQGCDPNQPDDNGGGHIQANQAPVDLIAPAVSNACIRVSHTCPTDIFFPWRTSIEITANSVGVAGHASCINTEECETSICGTTNNACLAGVSIDKPDSATHYQWLCDNVGVQAEDCSLPIVATPEDGVCSATVNQCQSGNFQADTDTATAHRWNCLGTNGSVINVGSTASIPACGAANGVDTSAAPSANLCNNLAGISATAVTGSGPWSWSCTGNPGTSPVNCSAGVLQSYQWVKQGTECHPDPGGAVETFGGTDDPDGSICFAPGAVNWWNSGSGCWIDYECNGSTVTNGVCGPTEETCSAGTYQDVADTPTQWNWTCLGIGTNASDVDCVIPKPSDAVCGTNYPDCTVGQYAESSIVEADTSHWDCTSAAGADIHCTGPKIHGGCGSASASGAPADTNQLCSAGTPDNFQSGSGPNGEDVWNCMGIGHLALSAICNTTASQTGGTGYQWVLEFDIDCTKKGALCFAVKVYQCLNDGAPAPVDTANGCKAHIGLPSPGADFNATLNSGGYPTCGGGGDTCYYFSKSISCPPGQACLTQESDSGSSGSSGSSGCFVAGTEITLFDGSRKNIEEITLADILMGTDGEPVKIRKLITLEHEGYKYSINGSKHFVTGAHPFKTVEGWKAFEPESAKKENPQLEIGQLRIGDFIFTEDGIEELSHADSLRNDEKVYNFHVDGKHEYMADGYQVHNKCDTLSCPYTDSCGGVLSADNCTCLGGQAYYCCGGSNGDGTYNTNGCP